MTHIKGIFLTTFLLFAVHAFAQNDTTFYDAKWKPCSRADAKFYRLMKTEGDHFVVTDYYINNKPQMVAICSDTNPVVKNGKCTRYDENGIKSSEGYYTNNKESGLWIWWELNGTDSTVGEYRTDGTINYTRFSRSYMNKNVNGVYELADVMPAYPGGPSAMNKFIAAEFKLPKEDKKAGTKGTFYVSFVVDEEGNIVDPVIKKSLSKTCDAEAIRMVKSMPKWSPGEMDGKKVKVRVNIPITVK